MPLSQIEQQQLSKSQATPPQYSQQQQQVSAAEMGAIRYEQQLYPALQGRQMNHSQQQQQLLLSPRQGLPQQQEHRPTSQTMPTVYQPQEPPQFLDQQQYTTPPPHRMPMIYSPHGSPQLHQQYISAPHGMPMVYSQQRQPLSSMLNSQTHQPQALVNSQLQFQHSTRFHSEPTDQLSRQPQQSSVVAHQQLHSRPLACPSVDPEESELAECNEVQAVDQELSTAESLPPTPQNMFKMKKQHRPDVWHFMRLVRKDSCSDIPVDKLRSEHAGAASCKLCGELVDYRVGATVPVRRHMELKHAEKLDEFNQKRVAAKRSAGGVLTLSRDGAICSMPSPETVVISAITPEQQAHANELLAVWIAKRLRPFSIVEDDEFVAYVTYLTEVLGGVRVKVPGRTRLREDIVLVASRLRAKLRNLIRRECRLSISKLDAGGRAISGATQR
ncbi:hypothetical protein KRP22_008073 [Phytophthora ramorum]|nr:hypothetical protein KRP22_9202 [Phytophthora ramorum]KAH7505950.1 hypothetical protein KRP22_3917 [Phytophthora ramorum]